MIKRLLTVVVGVLLFATLAVASIHGSNSTPLPVLQNVSDTFGNLTPAFRGGVFINSVDQNYGTGFNPKGFDMLASGTCAKWSTAQTGGTAGDFDTYSHVADASATTPRPTSAGVIHGLVGGPYTFLVSCEDSSNNVLATATLTRTIDTAGGCGAVNFGTGDRNDFGVTPSGFASSCTGAKIMYSVGYSNPTGATFAFGGAYTNPVTVTWADTSREGALNGLIFNPGSGNYIVKDFNLTGTDMTGLSAAVNGAGAPNINMDNVHAYYTAATPNIDQITFFNGGSCTGAPVCTVNNFSCDWCATGMTPPPHYLFTNGYFRYFQNNCLFPTSASSHDTEIDDLTCVAPQGNIAFHQDTDQYADGSSPYNMKFKRVLMLQADGTNTAQGFFWGGDTNGEDGALKGYVSSGAGVTTPGNVITFTSGSLDTGSNQSFIYSPTGSPVGLTDNVQLTCAPASNCGGDTTATLNTGSISYGSPGSPVTFYGMKSTNNTYDQVGYFGFTFHGMMSPAENGTNSFTHFTYFTQNVPNGGAPIIGAGPPIQSWYCDVPQLHNGTFTIGPGFALSGYSTVDHTLGGTCGSTPPANTTLVNFIQGGNSNTTVLLAYTLNPETVLEGNLPSFYQAMSVAQLKAYYCSVAQPKAGGTLDLGGGNYANVFGPHGFEDGTVIPGC